MIFPLLSPCPDRRSVGGDRIVDVRRGCRPHERRPATNPNVELVAQGVANIVGPFFGGLPATGAIARTATNIRSGARTPVAGMIHALTLLAVLLFAAPLARYIPLAVLAAILMVGGLQHGRVEGDSEAPQDVQCHHQRVADHLRLDRSRRPHARRGVRHRPRPPCCSSRKVAKTTTVSKVTKEYVEDGRLHILQDKHIPEYVTVVRIHGPFLFGAAEKLSKVTDYAEELTPVVILRLRNMTAIDATGLLALEDLADRLHRSGRILILCGARPQPAKLMRQAEFERHVGR